MNRILKTGPFPPPSVNIPSGTLVITPHTAAADTLGARKITLYDLASEQLQKAGLAIASEFKSFGTLKEAITQVEPYADPRALAARVRTILRTLVRTGVDVDELEARGSEQVKQLARIAREYEVRLNHQALVDNSAVLWRAAMLTPEPAPLFVYGYFRARKEEILFINAFAGGGSVYYLPCSTDPIFDINIKSAEYLASVGKWQVMNDSGHGSDLGELAAQRFVDSTAPAPVKAFSFPNSQSEVRFILGKAKKLLLSGVLPEEIAIVARDLDTYAPLFSDVCAEYGIATELRNKVAMNQTLLGSFIECLLAANETNFEFEATASLLMHPFGPGLAAREWKTARKNRVGGVEEWSMLSPHLNCLHWKTEAPSSEWVECLRDTMRALNVRKRAGAVTREILAFNAFMDALTTLDQEADLVSQFTFFNTVRELMASTHVPFQPSRGGVSVHNLDTIQGAKYKHLFVAGMAEGVLPAPVVDNPVIDFFERARLAASGAEFEEAAEVARWSALSFYFTLLTASGSLTLCVPMMIGDSHKISSPYLARLGIVELEPGILAEVSSLSEELRVLLRSEALADEAMDRARARLRVEAVRESVQAADEFDGVIGIAIDPTTMPWSASQFTVLGQCPYRWFAQKVLELKPAEESEISLSSSVRGNLYHKALELAVGRAGQSPDLRQAVLDVLAECFTIAECDPEVGLPRLNNWSLQRHEHLRALRKAVISPDFIEEGATVVSFEEKFETLWNNLQVRGRIDRVDRTVSGLVAIDYKTSSSAPHGVKNDKGKSNVDIQLVVYSQIALPHLYPEETIKKGLYYSLTKGKVLKSIECEDMPSLVELVDKMHSHLSEGRFAVDPDIDGNACKYCDYDAMCRKGTRLARKTKS